MIIARNAGVRTSSGKWLVHPDDFSVSPGETLMLAGPNGAGKSTLVRMLAGEIRPSCGEVRINECPLGDLGPRELASRRAVLPQSSLAPPGFTALEIVMLGFSTSRVRESELRRRGLTLLEKSETLHLAHRMADTLSGGELQRVHFSRVLAQLEAVGEPAGKYLFLDEPSASLDLRHQHLLFGHCRELAREGVGVVAVLHDLNLVLQYGDRIVVLKEGRRVAAGPPGETLLPELVSSVFDIGARVIREGEGTVALVFGKA